MAEVQGKHSIHALGRSVSPTIAIIASFVALGAFLCTNVLGLLISTSVSSQALTMTRTRIVTGFFRSNWSLQSTERLGHVQQLLAMNSNATAGAVQNLSAGIQSALMLVGLLGVALAVDPAAALGVIGLGIVLSVSLRPSHRTETTAQCDLLLGLVLDNGKIAEYGERDAVLAGSAYRNIVLTRQDLGGDDTSGEQ